MRRVIPCAVLALVLVLAPAAAQESADSAFTEGGGGECTLTFDDVCPDTNPTCATRISGGDGCVVEGMPFCYDSGMFSYKVTTGDRAQIRFKSGISEIEVFFAQAADGQGGRMTFFDANGLQVGPAIFTNGNCSAAMPATQTRIFDRPVVRVRVQAFDADVFIDSMRIVKY